MEEIGLYEGEKQIIKAKNELQAKNYDVAKQMFENIMKRTAYVGLLETCKKYLNRIPVLIEEDRINQENRKKAKDVLQFAFKLKQIANYNDAEKLFKQAKDICKDEDITDQCNIELQYIEILTLIENKKYSDALSKIQKFETVCNTRKEEMSYYKELCNTKIKVDNILNGLFKFNITNKIKELKSELKYQDLIDYCDMKIREIQEENQRKKEESINLVYNKGVKEYNDGQYKWAIESLEDVIRKTNDKNLIKECEEMIESCKNEIDQQEQQKARELFDDGLWYYRNGSIQSALWKFEDALKLLIDYNEIRECEEMIDCCKNELNC